MDEEEPAWRREMREQAMEALARVYGHRWTHATEARRDILRQAFASKVDAIMPLIQAAEERGRREALKQHAHGLKADWGRFRGRVLQEAWEALRDAEGGPLIDAMHIVNDLLEQP